jgi:hypothetical protein
MQIPLDLVVLLHVPGVRALAFDLLSVGHAPKATGRSCPT